LMSEGFQLPIVVDGDLGLRDAAQSRVG